MSIARLLAVAGIALLLTGCAPVTSAKSIIALIAMVITVGATAWGLSHNKEEDRVVKKAEALDQKVAEHARKYHTNV